MSRTKPECCNALEIKLGVFAHQSHCKNFDGEENADRLRTVLNNVRIGWWADQVLEIFGKDNLLNRGEKQVNKEHIWIDPYFDKLEESHPHARYKESYVVEWVYPGFTLQIARGFTLDPLSGKEISVYAVQEMKSNNERKKRKRPRKPKPKKSGINRS